jgi:hypothetical protein
MINLRYDAIILAYNQRKINCYCLNLAKPYSLGTACCFITILPCRSDLSGLFGDRTCPVERNPLGSYG